MAKLVLDNAFFVDPSDRNYTSARLVGISEAKDKALVEIYTDRGPLAEEWYHVVIKRGGRGWTFPSIIQVAIS